MSDHDSSSEASVVIERWISTYLVPADHPAPLDLKARLDQLVTGELTATCSRWLSPLIDPADPSVWLIREVSLDLVVDASRGAESRVAKTWAERLAVEITQIITRGEEGDSVLRFPNRAAYLARFLKDISAGQAWEKWYYREFDSLRSLDASSAICEALIRESGHAPEVLAQLATGGGLEDVLGAVNELGAARIYGSCFSQQDVVSAANTRLWTNGLLELWAGIALGPVNAAGISSHDRLRLYAFTKVWFVDLQADAGLREAIDGLLELRRLLSGLNSYGAVQEFMNAAALGDDEQANRILGYSGLKTAGETLEFLAQASTGDDWNRRLVALIAPGCAGASRTGDASSLQESFFTAFGGIFLLGPSFVQLRIEEAIGAAVATCSKPEQAGPIIRHLLAVKCMGGQRGRDAIGDKGLKLFAKLDHAASAAELSRRVAEADHGAALRVFAETLADERRISAECLRADLVTAPGLSERAIVIQDAIHDEWIYIAAHAADGVTNDEAVRSGLQFAYRILGELPRTLLLGAGLAGESRRLEGFAQRVFALTASDQAAIARLAAENGIQSERLLREERSIAAALEYFSLAAVLPDFEVAGACDLAWSLVARAVLKNFARRLIGFEFSSPKYLFENFLAGMSSVHAMPGRIEVQPPSTPLSVVLHLSGAYAQDYELPWLKETEICLRAPSD